MTELDLGNESAFLAITVWVREGQTKSLPRMHNLANANLRKMQWIKRAGVDDDLRPRPLIHRHTEGNSRDQYKPRGSRAVVWGRLGKQPSVAYLFAALCCSLRFLHFPFAPTGQVLGGGRRDGSFTPHLSRFSQNGNCSREGANKKQSMLGRAIALRSKTNNRPIITISFPLISVGWLGGFLKTCVLNSGEEVEDQNCFSFGCYIC